MGWLGWGQAVSLPVKILSLPYATIQTPKNIASSPVVEGASSNSLLTSSEEGCGSIKIAPERRLCQTLGNCLLMRRGRAR